MYHVHMTESSSRLAQFLRQRMTEMDLSFRELSRKSGVSHGALGNALGEGDIKPRAETLKRLAKALKVDEAHLFRLAGHIQAPPPGTRDPVVERLANALNELPPELRSLAISSVTPLIEAFQKQAGVPLDSKNTIARPDDEIKRLQAIIDDLTETIQTIKTSAEMVLSQGGPIMPSPDDKEQKIESQSITDKMKVLPKALVEKIIKDAEEAMRRVQQAEALQEPRGTQGTLPGTS